MTLLDRTTLGPPVPSASGPAGSPGSAGPDGIPPAAGNSARSAASAGEDRPGPVRLAAECLPGPGARAGPGSRPRSGPPTLGGTPGSGVPAAVPPPDRGRAGLAALRPARGAGVLIRLLRCGGPAGLLWLDGIGFRSGVGGIGPGWARFPRFPRTPIPDGGPHPATD